MNICSLRRRGAVVLSAACALLVAGVATAGDIAVDLKALPSSISRAQAAGVQPAPRPGDRLQFTLRNTGSTDTLLVRWDTALAGISNDLFEVTRDGAAVPYIGRLYKRGLPEAADYIEIKAGEQRQAVIDLSQVYDMSRPGNYLVRFAGSMRHVFDVHPVGAAGKSVVVSAVDEQVKSAAVALWVDRMTAARVRANNALFNPLAELRIGAAGPNFRSCSVSHQDDARAGLDAAGGMANSAAGYLNANRQSSRYSTWFGSRSNERYGRVRSNFGKIADAVNNKTYTVVCDCDNDGSFAFVYPNRPYEVHLCSAYWRAPVKGTDSKGGTIVHETSHFNAVAGTNDIVYGQPGARDLARRDPDQAVRNADSHEYFAENTPLQN